ncbi:hypothetical protein ACHWQZ_G019565 [Mnemiopsis leidyi]
MVVQLMFTPFYSMSDGADKENVEKQGLPAFQRSKQISDIFTNVENILPSMDFSDTENEDDDSESVQVVTRDYKPVVTHVSNKNGDDVTSDIVLPGEFESPKSKKEQRAEKEITELSVHSFIDSLVCQIAELPKTKKTQDYKLENNTDLDLDQLICLLESSHDIKIEDTEHDSDVESEGSSSTIVMDELARLAETYDIMDNTPATPRPTTPNSRSSTPNNRSSTPNNRSSTPNNRSNTPNNRSTTPNNKLTTDKNWDKADEENTGSEHRRGTVMIDLRPATPDPAPARRSGRIVPSYLTKKLQRPPSSDSDDETENAAWENMRRNIKSTSFFSSSSPSGNNLNESHHGVSKSVSTEISTLNVGISTRNSGVSTQSTGVSTASTGVSTQSMGVSTKNSGISTGASTKSSGTSTKSFGASSDLSLKNTDTSDRSRNLKETVGKTDNISIGDIALDEAVKIMNSFLLAQDTNGSPEGLFEPTKFLDLNDPSSVTSPEKEDGRAEKGTGNVARLNRGENTRSTERRRRGKRTSEKDKEDQREGITQENGNSKRRFAWSDELDNSQNNENCIVNRDEEVENKTSQKIKEEERLKMKKQEEEMLKSQRMEQMRVREKRTEFRTRLEEQNRDRSCSELIFDIEESFTEKLQDVSEEELDSCPEQLVVLQLMIDNQGELSSLPPEYYSYCYDDIPTVSYYGTEGVLTWILTSRNKPFTVLTARLTFISNCLAYIFLVKSSTKSPSPNLYKDIGHYFSSHSIAQSDPQLFKSTLLNPRDYPFCEPLNKLFLVSKYNKNLCLWFTAQPSWFSFNLAQERVNEVHGTKSKQRLTVSEVQANVSPPTSTEFCVSTLSGGILKSQAGLFHVLSSVRDTQLEMSALRLVQTDTQTETQTETQTDSRTLSIALSGYSAISRWSDKLGAVDTELALRTNSNSVRAVLSKLDIPPFTLTNTRTADKTRQELARYFGYRFQDTAPLRAAELTFPLVFERSYDFFFLLVSPLISPSLLGEILSVLQDNGVSLLGIRRSRLNYRKCVGLGLSECQTKVFSKFNGTPLTSPSLSSSNGSTPSEDRQFFPQNFTTDACPSQPTLASTILFLSKRNGMYHARHLVKELKSRVVDVNLSHTLQTAETQYSKEQLSDPYLYFEIVPHSENNLWNVGGQFGLMPERKTFDFFMSHKQEVITEKCDLEQIVFIALIGRDVVASAGKEIHNIIHYCDTLGQPVPDNETGQLELLGVKLIGKLNSFQAREVTQFEVGDPHWKSDIQYLQTVPIIALLVRGINAFQIVKQLLSLDPTCNTRSRDDTPARGRGVGSRDHYTRLMSETPEHAYKLASLLFFEKELYSDEIMRPKQLHLPPPRTHVNSIISKEGRHHLSDLPDRLVYQSEGILKTMLAPPRLLASVLVTSLVNHFGKILKRLEQEEFTIVGIHLTPDTDHVVFCVQAENCIYKLLQLVGPPDLKEAKSSHQFSLRASFASQPESFYASPTYSDSVTDVKRYFPEGLCCSNTLDMQAEGIPHSYKDKLVTTANTRRYISRSYPLKPLLQTVCVVFPPDLLRPAKHMRLSPASQLITMIQGCQFEIVNARLLTIPSAHLQKFRTLFKVHYELSQTFVNRSCLVFVLQRENASSCFSQILQGYSNCNNKKVLDSYDHMMLTSTNKKTCEEQIKFFFDFLSARCKDQIETQ